MSRIVTRDEAVLWLSVRIFDHLIGTIADEDTRQDEFGAFGDALRALGVTDDEIARMGPAVLAHQRQRRSKANR